MSNSNLVTYTKLSPNYSAGRAGKKIIGITPHCMVAQWTAKQACDFFYNSGKRDTNKASANYCIGYDGSIGLCVSEENRSWCSSSSVNDNQMITIEIASDTKSPYKITEAAFNSLVKLSADICKRNGIDKLKYVGDDIKYWNNGKQNISFHKWFSNKACPGANIIGRMPKLVEQVNASLTNKTVEVYRIRKTWADTDSQIGAYANLTTAKSECDKHPGYSVYNSKGKAVYTVKEAVVEIYRLGKNWADAKANSAKYASLAKAKTECNKHIGYSVYNNKGTPVHRSTAKYTAEDAMHALRMVVGLEKADTKYDMDKDGKVTVEDARTILNKVIGDEK